jgi:hypothetical protein
MLAAIVAIAFFVGREFGVFSKSSDRNEAPRSWDAIDSSEAVAPWEHVKDVETADDVATLEETEEPEVATDAEDAAIE